MKQRKTIIRNGVVIYEPRKGQLRELSVDEFMKATPKRVIKPIKDYSDISLLDDPIIPKSRFLRRGKRK